jgi:hypothetical protein
MNREATDTSVKWLETIDGYLVAMGENGLAGASLRSLEGYLSKEIASSDGSTSHVVEADGLDATRSIARHLMFEGRTAELTRLYAYLLPIGVLPEMARRFTEAVGDDAARQALDGLRFPPAGSPPEAYPKATAAFVGAALSKLGAEGARAVMTCNVHGIPASAHEHEKARLAELGSIDAWLEDHHTRKVAELEAHEKDGTLWYEQRITKRVVEFIRSRQDVLSGVRLGDVIRATKIPYDPDRWLASEDRLERRRLACHCPLAASGIGEASSTVDPAWCACSAGYEKFLFDVAFGEACEARVLHSVLDGSDDCLFEIKIPEKTLAKYGG